MIYFTQQYGYCFVCWPIYGFFCSETMHLTDSQSGYEKTVVRSGFVGQGHRPTVQSQEGSIAPTKCGETFKHSLKLHLEYTEFLYTQLVVL